MLEFFFHLPILFYFILKEKCLKIVFVGMTVLTTPVYMPAGLHIIYLHTTYLHATYLGTELKCAI